MEAPTTSLSEIERLVVAYPSGNATAVVFDKLEDVDRKSLNDRILGSWKTQNPDKPEIEQCCLVTDWLNDTSSCHNTVKVHSC